MTYDLNALIGRLSHSHQGDNFVSVDLEDWATNDKQGNRPQSGELLGERSPNGSP